MTEDKRGGDGKPARPAVPSTGGPAEPGSAPAATPKATEGGDTALAKPGASAESAPKPEAKPDAPKPGPKPEAPKPEAGPGGSQPAAASETRQGAKPADARPATPPAKPSEPAAASAAKPAARADASAAPPPARTDAAKPASARGSTLPLWIAVVGLALVVLWLLIDHPALPTGPDPALAALERRIATLEQRPSPAPPPPAPDARVGALESRLAALEARPAPTPPPPLPPVDQEARAAITALSQRLAALENRPLPSAPEGSPADAEARAAIASLQARLSALEARPAPPPPPPSVDQEARAALAALQGRVQALEARPVAPDQSAALAALEARLAALGGVTALLEQGRPLGAALAQLPAGTAVPPALAAFAERPPPTLAELRLAFPEAARAAREAADAEAQDAWSRAAARLSSLITVRKGDEVLIGHPVAQTLARIERSLEAGDVAGAVAAADALTGGAREAIAPWRARAEALIAARAAIAELARSR